jgi:hypothetical protein
MRWLLPFLLIATLGASADTVSITVIVGDNPTTHPAQATVIGGSAILPDTGLAHPGNVIDNTVHFDQLQPSTYYDIQLNFSDGSILRGVDMAWYNDDDPAPGAGPLSDGDIQHLNDILHVPSFYNKADILLVQGDHDRAVALVRLVRDKDFYSGAGQVIWRIELWYFKYNHGGWEKIAQQNKVLRRERFKTVAEYHAATDKLHYSADLGGLSVDPPDHQRTVKVAKE